jgi:hypothetical protein
MYLQGERRSETTNEKSFYSPENFYWRDTGFGVTVLLCLMADSVVSQWIAG